MPAQLPFAVATRAFGIPLRAALRRAADAGASGVQFDLRDELPPEVSTETGRRQFIHLLSEYGLKVGASHFSTRRALYASDQLDRRVAAVRDAMSLASQLKSRVLTVRIGPIPADDDQHDRKLLSEVLDDLVRHGNHVGVTLALSTSGEEPSRIHGLVNQIKSGPIGIDFDPSSFVFAGRSVSDAYRTLHQEVVHIQARDGVRDLDGTGAEVILGRGQVDWLELLALLYEAGYQGWLTAIRNQGGNRGADVETAISYLKEVFVG